MLGQRASRFEANATVGTRNESRTAVQILAVKHLQGGGARIEALPHLGHILRRLLDGKGQAGIHIRPLLRLLVEEHEPLALLIVVLFPAQGQLAGDALGATCARVRPLRGLTLLANRKNKC